MKQRSRNSVLYVHACDIAATFVCMRIPVDMRMVSTSLRVPSLLTLEQLGGDATKGFQDDTTVAAVAPHPSHCIECPLRL